MWMHDMYTAVVGYIERRLIWYFFGRAVCAVGRIRTGIYRNILWFVFAFLFFFLSPFSKFLGHLRQAFLVLLLHRFNRYILLFFSFLVFMFFSRNTLVSLPTGPNPLIIIANMNLWSTSLLAFGSILYLEQISIHHVFFPPLFGRFCLFFLSSFDKMPKCLLTFIGIPGRKFLLSHIICRCGCSLCGFATFCYIIWQRCI